MFPPLAWKPLSPEIFGNILSWLDFPSLAAFKTCSSSIASAAAFKAIEATIVKHAVPGVELHGTSALAWAAVVKRGERVARELGEPGDVLNTLREHKGFRILEIVAEECGSVVTLCVVALVTLWKKHANSRIRNILIARLSDLLGAFPEARIAASMVGLLSLICPNLKKEMSSDLRVKTANLLNALLVNNRQASREVAHSEIRRDVIQLLRDGNGEESKASIQILIHLLNFVGEEIAKDVCTEVRLCDCIPRIVGFVEKDVEMRLPALMVLDCMAGDGEGSAAIRSAKGVSFLIEACQIEAGSGPSPPSQMKDVVAISLSTLCKMCGNDLETCTELLRLHQGLARFWLMFMKSKVSISRQSMIVDILGCLVAADQTVASQLRGGYFIETLLPLVSSQDAYLRDATCATLHVLVKADRECAALLHKEGGRPILTSLANRTNVEVSEMWLGSVVSSYLGTTCAAANQMAALILKAMGEDDSESIASLGACKEPQLQK